MKIKLLNLPFASLARPSIALTQLKSVVQEAYGDAVEVEICYLNHDFGERLGQKLYQFISDGPASTNTGIGDWFFRPAAFPQSADNPEAFFARFGHLFDREQLGWFQSAALPIRRQLRKVIREMIDGHRLAEADVVGLTSMFSQNLACASFANELAAMNARQIRVMGGANCEGPMGVELLENFSAIDFVASGPGLVSFPAFVGKLLAGDREGMHMIDGIFSRRNARSVVKTLEKPGSGKLDEGRQLQGIRPIGAELDINVPVALDYDDFFVSLDRRLPDFEGPAQLLFETSRGCWWGERAHCTFCGLNGETMSYRAMSPDHAQRVIEGLIQRYAQRKPGREIEIESVDNILPREYFDTLFDKLRPPSSISLFYEVKADLTDAQVGKLAASGVRRIQPGIESFSTATLKLMRKGTTAFNNIRLLMHCLRHGVQPLWNLLVGSPGEVRDTYRAYLDFLPNLFHLPPPSGVYPIRFDRFSPYFNSPETYGLKLRPIAAYELCYDADPRSLMNLAYFFENEDYEAAYVSDLAGAISALQRTIHAWNARWQGPDASRPKLDLVGEPGRHAVHDTRGPTLLRIPLSEDELALLAKAIKPIDVSSMSHDADLVEDLADKGLIFRERGRIMNLVSNLQPSIISKEMVALERTGAGVLTSGTAVARSGVRIE